MISYGITHVGKVRKVNQDAFYSEDTHIGSLKNLFLVADGMGGHQGGEVASKMAVDSFLLFIEEHNLKRIKALINEESHSVTDTYSDFDLVSELIFKAISRANQKIYAKSVHYSELFGMGTTIVAATIYEDKLIIGHVGDSRLYILGDNFEQITKDHSYVQELVDMGEITQKEAKNHPKSNQITRAVGVDKQIDIDIIDYDLSDSDRYILICSDGLTGMLTEDEIVDVLKSKETIKEKALKLQEMTLNKGATDNVTLIIIDIQEVRQCYK